jgi:chromosome segregation ATPase
VVVRGYDRHAVERRLGKVADSYTRILRQRDELREWLDAAEARIANAEEEAKASAREVGALTHRAAAGSEELAAARRRIEELEHALAQARQERHVTAPASVSVIPEANVAELLLAAKRASEQLRASAREEARTALHKARARAEVIAREADRQRRSLEAATARLAVLSAQAEREQRAAEEARARRDEAEREAGRLLDRARSEAERAFAALGEHRRRVQGMLGQALEALGVDDQSGDVLQDLSSRLRGDERQPAEDGQPAAERGS